MKNQPRKKDEIYFLRNRRSDRGDDDLHAMIIICYVLALPLHSLSLSLSLYRESIESMQQDINTTKLVFVQRKKKSRKFPQLFPAKY